MQLLHGFVRHDRRNIVVLVTLYKLLLVLLLVIALVIIILIILAMFDVISEPSSLREKPEITTGAGEDILDQRRF